MTATITENSGLQAQKTYVESLTNRGFRFGLTVGDAFVRGIRDLGYRHTGTALDELIDNAIQAEAGNIHVIFGDGAKPKEIAVVDDGHGMVPDMIRLAVIWGGTHREDNRRGFGRYGFGLPSASVSQGKRFTVYSATGAGNFHAVPIDLEEISEGKLSDNDGEILVPEAQPEALPDWVQQYITETLPSGKLPRGTVVVIDKIDRLTWKAAKKLKEKLLQHFGVTYRNYLREVTLRVAGTKVEPIDPLFITKGFRFYDVDEERAEALDPLTIAVKDDDRRKTIGEMKVRFSYLPPTFASIDKGAAATGKNRNPRFQVMKDHEGFIFTRLGRQIDVVTRNPWVSIQTNDRYWGVEVDFSPELDEEFSMTTAKQRVEVSDRIWNLLKEHGVQLAVAQMRKNYDAARKKKRAKQDSGTGQRASEKAMEQSGRFIRPPAPGIIEKRQQRGDEELRKEALRRARETDRPVEETEQLLLLELEGRHYKVFQESRQGAPFFRAQQLGGTKALYINTSHRFFSDVYSGPHSNPAVRAALEVLLFVIGDCMEDSTDDRRIFYEVEINEWSKRLDVVLTHLSQNIGFGAEDSEGVDVESDEAESDSGVESSAAA